MRIRTTRQVGATRERQKKRERHCFFFFSSSSTSSHSKKHQKKKGLTRGFCAGTIYCSPVTAALILHDTPRVKDQSRVVALEVGRTHRIRDGRCGAFDVTLVDANHCPGACVLVFDVPCADDGGGGGVGGGAGGVKKQEATTTTTKRRIVHTGDFRFHESLHGRHPLLLSSALAWPEPPPPSSSLPSSSSPSSSSSFPLLPPSLLLPDPSLPVDTLLLDTTYAHPRHCHPSQELAIRACAEFCRRESAASQEDPCQRHTFLFQREG